MAHDFNNILNIISSYAERAIRLDDPEKRNESFDAIRGAVGRGSAVVRHLLTFARRDEGSFRVVDVNEILRDVLQMVQASFPRNIRVIPDLDTTLPLAHADPNQLHQTFLNLFVNARDAMPDGGELRVTTALKPSGELRRQHPEAARDFYICVMVRDEGLGMDDETRQRVFEPFFTTKGRTGGSGMGLAVVYGVVTSHQGFVDFDTAFGEGTVFRIYLPVFTAMQVASEGGGAPQAEKRPPGGTETILFVEDEEMLLTAVGDILRQQGYRVLTASTGEQALEIYRKNRKSIDLVVSDLELPQSSGWDTFLEMRKRAPKLDAVIVSGYVEPALREKMIDGGARAFLRKPYTAEALLSAIRQALDERRPRKSPLKRAAPAEKTRRSGSARRQSKRRRAARRPLAMAPGTVPFSSRSVASPAKKRVRATGSARRAGADEPPTA
jgi:DNA-binding response OmpR family regulator/two-component sensor histidine kinase